MFEVEIKSLLGSKENVDQFRQSLENHERELVHHGSHSQLNHYFITPDDMSSLEEKLLPYVSKEAKEDLKMILEEGNDHSVRTRKADDEVLIVIKASVGDDTSANGVSRIEFEESVDMSLDNLDKLLLDAGLEYQAKWSRDREEFSFGGDVTVTIDKNAGYGYLAELEKEIGSEEDISEAETEIRELMSQLGIEELSQDRLERMFSHYNENWADYYGTDKTFVIE